MCHRLLPHTFSDPDAVIDANAAAMAAAAAAASAAADAAAAKQQERDKKKLERQQKLKEVIIRNAIFACSSAPIVPLPSAC